MENSAEALKLAGFTLLFVTALTIALTTVMQGKRTSETIISYSDKTKYYSMVEQIDATKGGNRIVTIYDIIPTLYRYKQEEYIVLFENSNNQPLPIFDGETNINTSEYSKKISYLNYNLEDKLQEKWRQNDNTVKGHVDEIVKYLLNKYNDSKKFTFIETIETTNDIYRNNADIIIDTSSDQSQTIDDEKEENKEIRVIKYTLYNKE